MKVAQSCLTFCKPMDCSPWNSPGQNTGVGGCSLLQGTFPIQTAGFNKSGRFISHHTKSNVTFLVSLQGGISHVHLETLVPLSGLSSLRTVDGSARFSVSGGQMGERENYTWKVLMGRAEKWSRALPPTFLGPELKGSHA